MVSRKIRKSSRNRSSRRQSAIAAPACLLENLEQRLLLAATITVDIADIAPDPRNTGVGDVTITFSEAVEGFSLADLALSRDGDPLDLSGALLLPDSEETTWSLQNIGGVTAAAGNYTLAVVAAGSGIQSLGGGGNTIDEAGEFTDSWVTDLTAPVATIEDLASLTKVAVAHVGIGFDDAVVGFTLDDLALTRGGVPLDLAGATLTDNGDNTFTLSGLAGLTAADGAYVLTLKADAVSDAAGNAAATVSESWTMDATRPTADITDVTPDPRETVVASIDIVFDGPVLGFDKSDLSLTRTGAAISLADATLTSVGNTYTLSGLTLLTGSPGTYVLTVNGAGVADAAGNTLAANVTEQWKMVATRNKVSIAVTDDAAAEHGSNVAVFVVSRTGALNKPLNVYVDALGSARNGTDYPRVGRTVTIPAGQSSTTVTITPVDDALAEADEVVTLRLANSSGYVVNASARQASATIVDDECRVSIFASEPLASEQGSVAGQFTVTRTVVTDQPLAVRVKMSGSARSGSDYAAIARTVIIPANVASATFNLTPVDDTRPEDDETAVASLASGTGYSIDPLSAEAEVVILDNDCRLRLSSTDLAAAETGLDTATFTVTRTVVTNQSLKVWVGVSGTARYGSDYVFMSTVVIPAGQASTTVTIMPRHDSGNEGLETIVLTLLSSPLYSIDPTADVLVVSLTE